MAGRVEGTGAGHPWTSSKPCFLALSDLLKSLLTSSHFLKFPQTFSDPLRRLPQTLQIPSNLIRPGRSDGGLMKSEEAAEGLGH